jgi:hypothetical protein
VNGEAFDAGQCFVFPPWVALKILVQFRDSGGMIGAKPCIGLRQIYEMRTDCAPHIPVAEKMEAVGYFCVLHDPFAIFPWTSAAGFFLKFTLLRGVRAAEWAKRIRHDPGLSFGLSSSLTVHGSTQQFPLPNRERHCDRRQVVRRLVYEARLFVDSIDGAERLRRFTKALDLF